jgi:uncharacterized protein (TIGR03437 family)
VRFPLILLASLAYGQPPAILQEGIRNEASRIPPSLPGGALSPGSRVAIDGLRFPVTPRIQLQSGDRNWTITALAGSAKRLVFQLPVDVPTGVATLTLANADGPSRGYSIPIARTSAGLYTVNGLGWGPARALRLNAKGEREEISRTHPARAGDDLILESTGTDTDASLTVGNTTASIRWKALSNGRAELQFPVPQSAPSGCDVPVQLNYRNGPASNTVTIPVASPEHPCEPHPLWPAPTNWKQVGILLLARINLLLEMPGESPVQFTDEEAAFHVFAPKANQSPEPIEILPAPGTCLTYQGLYQQEFGPRQNLLDLLRNWLPAPARDTGVQIQLRNPAGRRIIPRQPATGDYFAFLGGERPDFFRPTQPLFLSPGNYQADAAGGADIGAWDAGFNIPSDLQSKSLARTGTVTRSRGLSLDWSGARSDPVYLLAFSVRHSTTAYGLCLCAAVPGAHQFTIPPEALSNLPATESQTTTPLNLIFLISVPPPTRFSATGLDRGFILPFTLLGRTTTFR